MAIPFGGYPYYVDESAGEPIDQQADSAGYDQSSAQPENQTQYPPQAQGQNAIARQPEAPASRGADAGPAQRSSNFESAPPPEEPVSDIGNFILVRRDGRILFASLFTVVATQLRYVTPDGIRHTMAMADIDSDATQQMNEARGTTVRLGN